MNRPVTRVQYRALSEVRYQIRRFATFSEAQARAVGVEPRQHQLLLAFKGLPERALPTIGRLAERLQIRHHSAVELVNRSVAADLVRRRAGRRDRREVHLELTARGRRVLEQLARAHRRELRSIAPSLLDALGALVRRGPSGTGKG